MELIQSVSDVLSGKLSFTIPGYQRGYKWKTRDIETLLNDINSFESTGEQFYCLQNITITEEKIKELYHVIDGQQRLTTAILILWFLGEKINNKTLTYLIRIETQNFLQKEIFGKDTNTVEFLSENFLWENVIEIDKSYDKQDIYHIFIALQCIKEWFGKKKEEEINVFKEKFLNRTKFIVNLIDAKNEKTVFRNLNSGKAEMDGADLVRAVLLTYSPKESGKKGATDELKEKRISLGIELDGMEQFWSKKEVKEYFASFYTFPDEKNKNDRVSFKKERGINYLYGLFLVSNGDEKDELDWTKFNWTNNEDALQKLSDLKKHHRILMDWYNNHELYHLIAFVSKHVLKNSLKSRYTTIDNEWKKAGQTREKFVCWLKMEIWKSFNPLDDQTSIVPQEITEAKIKELVENLEYGDNNALKILFLIDIIDHIENRTLSKLPIQYFDRNVVNSAGEKFTEDIEHIFPQTPYQKTDDNESKIKIDALKAFVETYSVLEELKEDTNEWGKAIENQKESNEEIDKLKDAIIKEIKDKGYKIDRLCNLALLYSSTNRSYGNKPFAEKRKYVFEAYQKNIYIRPHTINLFMNGLSDEVSKWGKQSLLDNESRIICKMEKFFLTTQKNK